MRRTSRRTGRTASYVSAVAMYLGVYAVALSGPSNATADLCPNEAFRAGAARELPDCRAYELVSPPDSNGRRLFDVSALSGVYDLFETELASPFAADFVFSTYSGPLETPGEADGLYDVYESRRGTSHWETIRRLTPSGDQAVLSDAGGVSADHRYEFIHVHQVTNGTSEGGSLAAAGSGDFLSKPDGTFELTGIGSLGTDRLVQGRYISPDGSHIIFTTGGVWCNSAGPSCKRTKLEPTAPPTGTAAVYDRGPDGPTQVVSLLPNDQPPLAGEDAEYQGAAQDGRTVAFKIAGSLYVRLDDAETRKVTGQPSVYAGLSAEGDALFYVSGGDIFRFATRTGDTAQINASGDAQVVNISADGSHVYFVSGSQLAGSNGVSGRPNLYVWAGGSLNYIATVLASDLDRTSGTVNGAPGLANWTSWVVNPNRNTEIGVGPGADSSRATKTGTTFIFESRAQLTTFDNNDHTEIYRFVDDTEALQCISCSPLADTATADARLQDLHTARPPMALHNLSEDGAKVFFETSEALVAEDSDGLNDIYEWEESQEGTNPSVHLISSGVSVAFPEAPPPAPKRDVLMGITPDGTDVFFLSEDALLPAAGWGGAPAIYDARVGGGLPEISTSPGGCVGLEGCRRLVGPAPELSSPASGRPRDGNLKPKRHRCRDSKARSPGHHRRGKCHGGHHRRGGTR
jgi:hypothetical protein